MAVIAMGMTSLEDEMETPSWQLLSIESLQTLANTMLSPSKSLSINDLPSLTFSCSHFNLHYSVLKPHHVPARHTAQLNTLKVPSMHFPGYEPLYVCQPLLIDFALQGNSLSWVSRSIAQVCRKA